MTKKGNRIAVQQNFHCPGFFIGGRHGNDYIDGAVFAPTFVDVSDKWGKKMTTLERDAERMLDIMDETVNQGHGWAYIYWIAVAVYHLLSEVRKMRRER